MPDTPQTQTRTKTFAVTNTMMAVAIAFLGAASIAAGFVGSRAIRAVQQPDLTIRSVNFAADSGTQKVTIHYQNIGRSEARSTDMALDLYMYPEIPGQFLQLKKTPRARVTKEPLTEIGNSRWQQFRIDLPSRIPAGEFGTVEILVPLYPNGDKPTRQYVMAYVDRQRDVRETNERNNYTRISVERSAMMDYSDATQYGYGGNQGTEKNEYGYGANETWGGVKDSVGFWYGYFNGESTGVKKSGTVLGFADIEQLSHSFGGGTMTLHRELFITNMTKEACITDVNFSLNATFNPAEQMSSVSIKDGESGETLAVVDNPSAGNNSASLDFCLMPYQSEYMTFVANGVTPPAGDHALRLRLDAIGFEGVNGDSGVTTIGHLGPTFYKE